MSLNPETQAELELARNQISNSDIDIDTKKSLLNALYSAAAATNGLSTEEKIHELSKAMFSVIVVQAINLVRYSEIVSNTKQATADVIVEHVKNCKYNVSGTASADDTKSWTQTFQQILLKPYIYISSSIIVFSPYAYQIINAILTAVK